MIRPPPIIGHSREKWLVLAVGLVAAAGAAVLFLFDPVRHGFYPVCVFHAATGLDCPGCGTLRALHQALHGRLWEALKLNPMVLVLGPILGWSLLAWGLRVWRGVQWRQPFDYRLCVWSVVVLVAGFALLRSLPVLFALAR